MKYLPLVWAALRRNRIESVLTLLALTVAFTLFASMLALNSAYTKALEETRQDRLWLVCRFECPGLPLAYGEKVARVPGVVAVGANLSLAGYRGDPKDRISVSIIDEGMRRAWPELGMSAADWRNFAATPNGVFVSRAAVTRRHLKKGDTLTVTTEPGSRTDGSTTWSFTVLGIVKDPPGWNQGAPDAIYGNFRYFNESRSLERRGNGGILRLATDNPDHARQLCRELTDMFTNSGTPVFCTSVRDDAQGLADANVNMRKLSLGIAAAGIFMILFLCANGTAESVRERMVEFATLKTLGFNDMRIGALVFLEVAAPTVIGASLGLGIAWLLGILVAHLSAEGVVRLPPTGLSLREFASALAIALGIAMVSAMAPLRRIKRMELASVMVGK